LILANVHSESGSVAEIKRILKEIQEAGIEPELYHNVLKGVGMEQAEKLDD